jgi:NTP pyrophosphatase (non-canonical NTP hydrolase)
MNDYEKAIAKWGEDVQLDVLVEECSELIKAVMKYKRLIATGETMTNGGKLETARMNVAEEAADVSIMLEQLRYMKLGEPFTMGSWIITKASEKTERLEALVR